MWILLINFVLFFIRLIRLDWRTLRPCKVNGKEVNMWDLKPGDVFDMDDGLGKLIVYDWPCVCWRTGNWGVWAVTQEKWDSLCE